MKSKPSALQCQFQGKSMENEKEMQPLNNFSAHFLYLNAYSIASEIVRRGQLFSVR